jgi:hypothetical protein
MTKNKIRIYFLMCLGSFLTGCGSRRDDTAEYQTGTGAQTRDADSEKQMTQAEKAATIDLSPRVAVSSLRSDGTSTDTLAVMDYQNADFVQTLRCSARYVLRSPQGFNARSASGMIEPLNVIEMKAMWHSSLSDTRHCRLLGEKMMRTSFSDPFAPSGTYFYIFNPCRADDANNGEGNGVSCSFVLTTTNNISLTNNINEEKLRLMNLLMTKEAQLASVALWFRSKLMVALEAQKRCEGNAAVDAVKEARTKALASLLGTGVAAAIGGVIAGPSGAVIIAQQALQWITQYYGPGTQANPSSCKVLKDAEAEAQLAAAGLESLRKEIGQIHEDLAKL